MQEKLDFPDRNVVFFLLFVAKQSFHRDILVDIIRYLRNNAPLA